MEEALFYQKNIILEYRVSEITKKLRQSKIVILFGDELLIEPKLLAKFALKVRKDNKSDSWNATSFNLKKRIITKFSC